MNNILCKWKLDRRKEYRLNRRASPKT